MEKRKPQIIFPNLRREMAYHDHRISDLAEKLNCKKTVVEKWLSGCQDMELYFAVQISKVYERSIDYLFKKEGAL